MRSTVTALALACCLLVACTGAPSASQSPSPSLSPSPSPSPPSPGPSPSPSPSPSPEPRLADGIDTVDWVALASLDCGDIGLGAELSQPPTTGDLTGDGVTDVVVSVQCATGTGGAPAQVQAYDGTTPLAAPAPLAILIPAPSPERRRDEGVLLDAIAILPPDVVVTGYRYGPDDPNACPSLAVEQRSTWTGALIPGPLTVTPVPAC
jgi:hypothetical protein